MFMLCRHDCYDGHEHAQTYGPLNEHVHASGCVAHQVQDQSIAQLSLPFLVLNKTEIQLKLVFLLGHIILTSILFLCH